MLNWIWIRKKKYNIRKINWHTIQRMIIITIWIKHTMKSFASKSKLIIIKNFLKQKDYKKIFLYRHLRCFKHLLNNQRKLNDKFWKTQSFYNMNKNNKIRERSFYDRKKSDKNNNYVIINLRTYKLKWIKY